MKLSNITIVTRSVGGPGCYLSDNLLWITTGLRPRTALAATVTFLNTVAVGLLIVILVGFGKPYC